MKDLSKLDFYLDGKKVEQVPISLAFSQSAYLWGDSLFTTFLWQGQNIKFWSDHLNRLKQSLKYQWDYDLEENSFEEIVFECLKKYSRPRRCRISFFYERDFTAHFVLEVAEIKESLNGPLNVKLILHPQLAEGRASFVKTGQYGDVLKSLRQAKDEGFDDIIFMDKDECLWESSFGNLFVIQDHTVYYTPPRNGILDGITKLNLLKETEFNIDEKKIYLRDLDNIDHIFTTNSCKKLTYITSISYDGKKWDYSPGPNIVRDL